MNPDDWGKPFDPDALLEGADLDPAGLMRLQFQAAYRAGWRDKGLSEAAESRGHDTKVAPVSGSSEQIRKAVRFLVRQSACPPSRRPHELWRTLSRCPQDPAFSDFSCCRTLRALSCPDPRKGQACPQPRQEPGRRW